MRRDSRLSRMLHVLIHMDHRGGTATSETIAQMLRTNPVVVRRTMAGLRDKGYVRSEKGHGGGWTLAQPLTKITLRDIHEAVGGDAIFALGPASDHPQCLVEQAVNAALAQALSEAEKLLLKRLGTITLADLSQDYLRRGRRKPGASSAATSRKEVL